MWIGSLRFFGRGLSYWITSRTLEPCGEANTKALPSEGASATLACVGHAHESRSSHLELNSYQPSENRVNRPYALSSSMHTRRVETLALNQAAEQVFKGSPRNYHI